MVEKILPSTGKKAPVEIVRRKSHIRRTKGRSGSESVSRSNVGEQRFGSLNDSVMTDGSGIANNEMDERVKGRLESINTAMARGYYFNLAKVTPTDYFNSLLAQGRDRNISINEFENMVRNNDLFIKLYNFALSESSEYGPETQMLKKIVNNWWGTLTEADVRVVLTSLIQFAEAARNGVDNLTYKNALAGLEDIYKVRADKSIKRKVEELFDGTSDWEPVQTENNEGASFLKPGGNMLGGRVTII